MQLPEELQRGRNFGVRFNLKERLEAILAHMGHWSGNATGSRAHLFGDFVGAG